ncbi:GNAT family N-acetyltransferase [Asticcacaulis sp. AC402]|uniref:GNAT family N-acetyltransferase n=1 Tax=Asticcacaulis sp. AC402 TaxID=1282361 RepID=UPI0003C3CC32|nr:GNAT family N-acetyltransferase [Asticcacaulis sp. AC402]ESQ76587.1 hypothetical protein ABAC402_02630 [Asticcacaulis sp. AC402]
MQIVPVAPAHVAILSSLARDCFSENFGHLYPPHDLMAFLADSYAEAKLAEETADPAQFWRIVLDDKGETAGYLHCGPATLPHTDANPACHGELKRIYVRMSHQGQGLGKQLLTTALTWLAETYGDAPQWLGVWSGNLRAQAFYATYGFERAGDYKFPVGNTLDDEFILRRQPRILGAVR